MINYLYEGVKRKLTEDLIIAYEVFKEEGYEDLIGVILSLNNSKGFGLFLREHPEKLADFSEHLYVALDFTVHLAFLEDGNDDFYPLIKNNKI